MGRGRDDPRNRLTPHPACAAEAALRSGYHSAATARRRPGLLPIEGRRSRAGPFENVGHHAARRYRVGLRPCAALGFATILLQLKRSPSFASVPTRSSVFEKKEVPNATPSPLNGEKAGPSPRRSGNSVSRVRNGFGRAGGMRGEAVQTSVLSARPPPSS